MVIIQLNVNSIRSHDKRNNLNFFIEEHKPHILLCSETKLNEIDQITVDGYNVHRNDRIYGDIGGGGTAIFIDNRIAFEQISIPNQIESIECCAIKIGLTNGTKLILFSIYKPPTRRIEKGDLDDLLSIDKNACVMLAGDFNAHNQEMWDSDKTCTDGKTIEQWYTDHKDALGIELYTPLTPTYFRNNKSSYIDFAFISNNIDVTNSNMLKKVPTLKSFSDHEAIIYKLQCKRV